MAPIDPRSSGGSRIIEDALALMRPEVRVALRHFERLFAIRSPDAENLAFVGAQVTVSDSLAGRSSSRLSVGGTGRSIDGALAACIGEGVELLSQFERPDDRVHASQFSGAYGDRHDAFNSWAAAHRPAGNDETDMTVDWLIGFDMLSGESIALPADLTLRRHPAKLRLQPAAPLSIGCAAGRTLDDAKLRAVLELIERDAAALWWQAGRPARRVGPGDEASDAAEATLEALRGAARGRTTWLLDITTEFAVPVLAAVSVDENGRGMACGLAARWDRREAAEAAVREMMQVELAYAVIAAKLAEAGEASLAPADRRHLARAQGIVAGTCELVRGIELPRTSYETIASQGSPLPEILDRLARASIRVAGLELTRPDLGLPVFRAVAPGLQTSAMSPQTPRLKSAVENHGGGEPFRCGIDLF